MEISARTGLRIKEAVESIKADLAGRVLRVSVGLGGMIELEIRREDVLDVGEHLRDHPRTRFDFLSCVSGVDRLDKMEVVYHLHSLPNALSLRLRTTLDIEKPVVDSVVSVWPGADWHEREAYDLFGITFTGHPYLRRIMLEDDFEGYPMRKSYPQPRGRQK